MKFDGTDHEKRVAIRGALTTASVAMLLPAPGGFRQ